MFNSLTLLAFQFSLFLAEDQKKPFPWWLILLILALIIVILIWALTRNVASSEEEEEEAPQAHAEEPPAVVVEPPMPEKLAAPVASVAPEPLVAEVVPPEPEPAPLVPDDLVIIEGIGPKIASVLKAAGIQTFAQLANAEPQVIHDILNNSDPRLARISDPTTWPEQARLAASGDMDALQKLQDSLKGGRRA
jgi:small subunit ribosomal protein S2